MLKIFFLIFLKLIFILNILQLLSCNESRTNDRDLVINDVIVFKNRAFICIPFEDGDGNNDNKRSTLYETNWINEFTMVQINKMHPFPNATTNNVDENVINCQSLDIDPKNRLWILDIPKLESEYSPKLLIYGLSNNELLQSCDFQKGYSEGFRGLIVDPVFSHRFGTRAYLIDTHRSEIIVYSVKEHRWWRLFVGQHFELFCLSKKDSLLYLAGGAHDDIFTINLNDVRKMAGPLAVFGNEEAENCTTNYLGQILGPTSAIGVDPKGNFYYYLTRDYALVKWDTKKPLKAESHKIILQSSWIIPRVSTIFFGPQLSMWAVINYNQPGTNGFPPVMPHVTPRFYRIRPQH